MSGGTTSGPRREQLAELDEGRAELVEHLAQVLAALRTVGLRSGSTFVPQGRRSVSRWRAKK